MSFTTYAEVLIDDHRFWEAYRNGSKSTPPGRPLRDVLADTDGRYEDTVDVPDRVMADLRRAAAVDPTDAALAAAAQSGKVRISLENLRGLDPDTPVVYGYGF